MRAELIRIVTDGSVATFLGMVIAYAYVRAYRGLLVSMSFVHTCAVTVLLVTLAVGAIREAHTDAGALGFALVGLLGLIRFRTVVRDTREFTFLFLAIVTGVLVGAGHPVAAIAGCLLALALLLALEYFSFGSSKGIAISARITGLPGCSNEFSAVLASVMSSLDPIGISRAASNNATYTYEGRALPSQDLGSIASLLRAIEGVSEVSVQRLQRGKKEGEGD